jgi:hypothetical protein
MNSHHIEISRLGPTLHNSTRVIRSLYEDVKGMWKMWSDVILTCI